MHKGPSNPDREGAQPVRRSLWSYGHLLLRSAKLDPRAPRRRSRSQRCIFVLDQGRLWASETIRRLPDEDPTSPNGLAEKATQRKAMSDRQRSLPALGTQPFFNSLLVWCPINNFINEAGANCSRLGEK